MPLTMTIDGFDPGTIGMEIVGADPRRKFPDRTWLTDGSPLSPNRVLLSAEPVYDVRDFQVQGRLTGTSDANFETRRDELVARLDRDDVVEVSFSDTSRIFFCRLVGIETQTRSLALTASDNIILRLQLLRPWAYDASTTTQSTITTATAIPLGTAPTRDVVLTVNGSATNPTILYKDSAGTTVKTLSFTITIGASGTLTINMLDGTIVDENGDSQQAARDTGTDFPFALDPRDGEHWNSNWPTLEIDSGDLDVTLRKAFG